MPGHAISFSSAILFPLAMSLPNVDELISILDRLNDSLEAGNRLLAAEGEGSFRLRLASMLAGEAGDANAGLLGQILENVRQSRKSILELLDAHGIEPFNAQGEPYNRERHEVAEGPIPRERQKVMKQISPGFVHHGRVIRKAKVVFEGGQQ